MKQNSPKKNPGPSWGYRFIRQTDRLCPEFLMNGLLRIGSLVALLSMKEQRAHSKAFLSNALGRPASFSDTWKHFHTFTLFLVKRFRCADGYTPEFTAVGHSQDRMEVLATEKKQALYGTFHFGDSDLMGFWLSQFELSIRMLRHQVGNSKDTDWLKKRFGDKVSFIWVNNPQDLLFMLKDAVGEGHSIAMKCDRIMHASKTEAFTFMGEKRVFPFTIYHLAILFDLPVVFAFGLQNKNETTAVYSSKIYRPDRPSKKENLIVARQHFQETLQLLDTLVAKNPYQWFNFIDAAPLAETDQ